MLCLQAHERLAEVALLTMENFAQTEPSADGVFTPMSSSSLLMRCAGVVSARSVKLVNRVTDRRDAQVGARRAGHRAERARARASADQ